MNISPMTYPDAYVYLRGINPKLAEIVNFGCRAGGTVDAVLAGARTMSFDDPVAAASWKSAIDTVRSKMREYGASLCTWVDPAATPISALMPAQALAVYEGQFQGNQGQFQGGPTSTPGGGRPGFDPQHPEAPHPTTECGPGMKCGPLEPGHCGKGCKGTCDSCTRPGMLCMWDPPPVAAVALPQACSIPGRWNLETIDSDLGVCLIDRLRRTKKTWSAMGQSANGSAYVVAPDLAHEDQPGFVWVALELDVVRLSHIVCLRSVTMTYTTDGGVTPVDPQMVYLEVEGVYQDGNGNLVHAWSYPKPEEEEYITITTGRCACSELCDCVPARARVRVLALVPVQAVPGGNWTMTAKGKRTCWGAACGTFPPPPLCDRSLVATHVCVALPHDAVGMVAMINSNAAGTGVTISEVFEVILAGALDYGFTGAYIAQQLANNLDNALAQDLLNPIIALSAQFGWHSTEIAGALDAAAGNLVENVFSQIVVNGFVTGAQYANALTAAPAGVKSTALPVLVGNYLANGWSAVQIAAAIDLAGGTLDVDVQAAIIDGEYITAVQYADSLIAASAGYKQSALTRLIVNYVANGWTATNIANAIVAAGGTLAADVKAALP